MRRVETSRNDAGENGDDGAGPRPWPTRWQEAGKCKDQEPRATQSDECVALGIAPSLSRLPPSRSAAAVAALVAATVVRHCSVLVQRHCFLFSVPGAHCLIRPNTS